MACRYYFDLAKATPAKPGAPPARSSIAGAHVRVMGNCAVVAYTRLVQRGTETGVSQETRVLQRVAGRWINVHFHRSAL